MVKEKVENVIGMLEVFNSKTLPEDKAKFIINKYSIELTKALSDKELNSKDKIKADLVSLNDTEYLPGTWEWVREYRLYRRKLNNKWTVEAGNIKKGKITDMIKVEHWDRTIARTIVKLKILASRI